MRSVLFAVLVALFLVVCGSRSSRPEPAAGAAFPAVACSTLTEAEITQFSRLLPTFTTALKAGNWRPVPTQPGTGPVEALATLVEGMNVPGMDESLKAAGSDWGAFRATMYKVLAASAARGVAGVPPERTEQMKKDTSELGRKALAGYQAMKQACAALPPANLKMVEKHHQDLQALGALGQ